VSLEVLYPIEITSEVCEIKDINEVSTVLRGSYGKFEFLLTGDIDTKIEDELRLTDKLTDVEVLKVAHHGSKTSTSGEFLLAVKPELAVISVGKNRFGHPTREVLERLRELGAMIKRTDEDGLVRLVSTGEKWWIK